MNEMVEKSDSILSWNSSTYASSNPEYAKVKDAFESAANELRTVVAQIMRSRAQCLASACTQCTERVRQPD